MKCPFCKKEIVIGCWAGHSIKLELVDLITYTNGPEGSRNKKVGTQLGPHTCNPKILLPKQKDLFT